MVSDSWHIRADAIHESSVWAMVGLIWIIQLVHYPAFRWIEAKEFVGFHHMHSQALSLIAGPLMLTQLATAYFHSQRPWLYLGLSLVVFILTFAVSVPIHNLLVNGKDPLQIERLISTNWWRTGVWSVHGLVLLWDRLTTP